MPHALVWGAAGGIGRALTKQLASLGWHVHAVCRSQVRIDGAAQVVEADVADSFAVHNAVLEIAQVVSDIQLSIYAAGDIVAADCDSLPPEEWRRILDANLTGAYLTAHHSLPLLAIDAHLIFIGAVHERLRLPGLTAYAAAKAGLEAFADALRKEQRGKRVTVVRPGAVDTLFWRNVPFRLPKNALTPDALADKVLAAHLEGSEGQLDL